MPGPIKTVLHKLFPSTLISVKITAQWTLYDTKQNKCKSKYVSLLFITDIMILIVVLNYENAYELERVLLELL